MLQLTKFGGFSFVLDCNKVRLQFSCCHSDKKEKQLGYALRTARIGRQGSCQQERGVPRNDGKADNETDPLQ